MNPDDAPNYEEQLKELGITQSDVDDYKKSMERSRVAMTAYQDWCRQNPAPSIKTKFDFLTTFTGPTAAKMMYFSKVCIEPGVWTRSQCYSAIFALGIGALWELHKKNSAVSVFMETLRKIEPELVARLEHVNTLVGARMHKLMTTEEFNQMAADFRDLTDLAGPT